MNTAPGWKAEEQRQTQLFADAIQSAIQATSKTIDTPILNALAGAIVTVEASMLAAIADPVARKALKKVMDSSRPIALAQAKVKSHVVVVNLSGPRQ